MTFAVSLLLVDIRGAGLRIGQLNVGVLLLLILLIENLTAGRLVLPLVIIVSLSPFEVFVAVLMEGTAHSFIVISEVLLPRPSPISHSRLSLIGSIHGLLLLALLTFEFASEHPRIDRAVLDCVVAVAEGLHGVVVN